MRIEKLEAAWNIQTRFVHFPLHPETPPDGLTLEELFAGRNMNIAAAQARMKQLMADEGLPYGDRTRTFNSRLAQELACYAATQPRGHRIHDALFRAYFVDGINIGIIDNLVEIGLSAGLEEDECRDVLTTRRYRGAVDSDWNRSRSLGITGVPAFVVGGAAVVGAQPYAVLEQLLEQSGATRRDSSA